MKDPDNAFLIEFGSLQARISNVEDQLKECPTRPELTVFTESLKTLAESQREFLETQKEQSEQIRVFNDYVNKWKGAAFLLMALGAMLTKATDLFINIFFNSNHQPPT